MVRVTRGVTKHRRHKKILAMAKGSRVGAHGQYRRAREALLHALSHAYRHRRQRKGEFRRLWVLRIGAASRQLGLSYSQLVHGLKLAQVEVNRKMLADMAVREPEAFEELVGIAKASMAS